MVRMFQVPNSVRVCKPINVVDNPFVPRPYMDVENLYAAAILALHKCLPNSYRVEVQQVTDQVCNSCDIRCPKCTVVRIWSRKEEKGRGLFWVLSNIQVMKKIFCSQLQTNIPAVPIPIYIHKPI